MTEFFVGCIPGTEDLLLGELLRMGIKTGAPKSGGVQFSGPLRDAYRVCLWSRIASRVLLPLTRFEAEDGDDVYDAARAVPWADHFSSQATFAVRCTLQRSQLHSHFLALRVKDAVVDRLREDQGSRPDVDSDNPDLQLNLHLNGNQAILYIDLAGPPLHRRGWRVASVTAPLRETLAAAILQRSGWPQKSRENVPFVDPLCGSGTFLMEALAEATDMASGIHRKRWGFQAWKPHPNNQWNDLMAEARDRWRLGQDKISSDFWALDHSNKALEACAANLKSIGLKSMAQLRSTSIESWIPESEPGFMVMNPPYGERLGDHEALEPFYENLGPMLRNRYQGWTIAVFGPDSPLLDKIHLKAFKINRFKNGPIQCRLMQYSILKR